MQHLSGNGSSKETKEEIEYTDSEVEYTNSEVRNLIDEYIHSERDRNILKRRLIDGIYFEPLAEEFNLSVRQVKNIVCKGSIKIFKHRK